MKYFFTVLIATLFWSSCSHDVRVVSVRSPILQNDTLLRQSNDTFEIVYNLFDNNGLLSFAIHNKSDVPLYVDWKRSAFISGTKKYDYWDDKAEIVLVTSGLSLQWLRAYGSTHHLSYGVISKPEQITFIPPQTTVTMSRFRIAGNLIDTGLKAQKVNKTYKKGTTTVKVKNYVEDNSPLSFRNFLTLSLKHDFSEEFYVDHKFWVNEITEMPDRQFNGPTVYVTEENGFVQTGYTYPYAQPNRFYINLFSGN
ncbi:MAG TPA: hypothetical protein VEC12_04605 [Bacteroidia bacterium]|nr:hypothetical protein [Bacteroidia bacterium]